MSTWPRRRPVVRLPEPALTGAGLNLLEGIAGSSDFAAAGLAGVAPGFGGVAPGFAPACGAAGLFTPGFAAPGTGPAGLETGTPGLGGAGLSPAGFETGTPRLGSAGGGGAGLAARGGPARGRFP